MNREIPVADLLSQAAEGQERAIAILISEIEGGKARAVVDCLVGRPPNAQVIGLTGPPGAGKSTLAGRLASSLLAIGSKVGVVAVDPSSPFSGGALLGDRVRMDWPDQARPFMRSMATRGSTGGLAGATEDTVALLSWLGFTHVIVETVGAGQNDLAIAGIADTVVVVSVPGLGDSVQTEKAGMYEIADLHVVNKSDRPEAGQLAAELRHVTEPRDDWEVPVLLTNALDGSGVEELRDQIERHRAHLLEAGRFEGRRQERARSRLIAAAAARAESATRARLSEVGGLSEIAEQVVEGTLSVYQALDLVLAGDSDDSERDAWLDRGLP
jgi:LAO/AO transport system kinase